MDPNVVSEIHLTVGPLLREQRKKLTLTQAVVAKTAKISASYYSALENSMRLPPTRSTLRRILAALECSPSQIEEAERIAGLERGNALLDINLPEEAQELIADIRRCAYEISPRFIRGLRTKIREAVAG